MDQPPPRRDPQNSTPPPLKVTKDSHKARKPPPHRQPLIIYEVAPTVHRVDPSGFMGLVQELTGPAAARPPPSEVERTRMPLEGNSSNSNSDNNMVITTSQMTGYEQSISGQGLGILPPGPGSIGPGSSAVSSAAQEPSQYIGLHHQQYPNYDMWQPGPPSSSSNAFIPDDDFSFDYFNSEPYQPQQDDDDYR